jgi:hypothetical protein
MMNQKNQDQSASHIYYFLHVLLFPLSYPTANGLALVYLACDEGVKVQRRSSGDGLFGPIFVRV